MPKKRTKHSQITVRLLEAPKVVTLGELTAGQSKYKIYNRRSFPTPKHPSQ